jgi:hypothetical protein
MAHQFEGKMVSQGVVSQKIVEAVERMDEAC